MIKQEQQELIRRAMVQDHHMIPDMFWISVQQDDVEAIRHIAENYLDCFTEDEKVEVMQHHQWAMDVINGVMPQISGTMH